MSSIWPNQPSAANSPRDGHARNSYYCTPTSSSCAHFPFSVIHISHVGYSYFLGPTIPEMKSQNPASTSHSYCALQAEEFSSNASLPSLVFGRSIFSGLFWLLSGFEFISSVIAWADSRIDSRWVRDHC